MKNYAYYHIQDIWLNYHTYLERQDRFLRTPPTFEKHNEIEKSYQPTGK